MTEYNEVVKDTVSQVLALPCDTVTGDKDCRKWFVMTSVNPQLVEECLLKENARRKMSGKAPFLFFVPYQFLERRITCETASDEDGKEYPESFDNVRENNSLRAALKRYIFIKSERRDLHDLLACRETKEMFATLWWLRDRNKRCVTVPAAEMEQFINVCCDMRIKFEICAASPNLQCNAPVKLKVKGFEGRKAWIIDVRQVDGRTELVCGFYIFAETAIVKLRHLSPDDVMTKWDGTASAREDNDYKFIEDVQRKVFRLINNRIISEGVTGAMRRKDEATLEKLNNYRYRQFSSFSLNAKYYALMILCVILSSDLYARKQFVGKATDLLGEIAGRQENRIPKDAVAYLHAALYVATGDLSYYEYARRYFISLPKLTATQAMLIRLMEEKAVWIRNEEG